MVMSNAHALNSPVASGNTPVVSSASVQGNPGASQNTTGNTGGAGWVNFFRGSSMGGGNIPNSTPSGQFSSPMTLKSSNNNQSNNSNNGFGLTPLPVQFQYNNNPYDNHGIGAKRSDGYNDVFAIRNNNADNIVALPQV